MTREEAINVLKNEIRCVLQDSCERIECASCDLVMPIEQILSAYDMAIAALREQEERRWIPVTERLPEIYDKDPDWSKTVLFRTVQGHIHSGYRNIGRPQTSVYDDDWTPPYWIDESENLYFEEDEVTHWMPLPEPPKEE